MSKETAEAIRRKMREHSREMARREDVTITISYLDLSTIQTSLRMTLSILKKDSNTDLEVLQDIQGTIDKLDNF